MDERDEQGSAERLANNGEEHSAKDGGATEAQLAPAVTPESVSTEDASAGENQPGADRTLTTKMQERLREVELEATLRFGAREMTLGEILELGPGDVIELDRQVEDAVDLLVGDKIVARGVAVLTQGCYGLRITEVAETRPALESVRCLF